MAAAGNGGPTALRILLGAQLRRLREARRITLEDAGKVIRGSGPGGRSNEVVGAALFLL